MGSNTNRETVHIIADSIKIFVENYIRNKKFNYDKTSKGMVVGQIDDYLYKVLVTGTERRIPSCTDQTYISGDTVLILNVQNGTANSSFIMGKVRHGNT